MTMSDDFDWDALENDMRDVVAAEAVNVTLLRDDELLTRFRDVTEELRVLGQMLRPNDEKGRDLHSMRGALRVELAKRRLM